MKNKLIVSLLAGAVAATSAQATGYVEIKGAHADFFYDSDFWAGSVASVTGDVISFSAIPGFEVSATAAIRGTATVTNQISDHSTSGNALVAVAHSGYTLSSDVQPGVSGNFTLPTTGGTSGVGNWAFVSQGDYIPSMNLTLPDQTTYFFPGAYFNLTALGSFNTLSQATSNGVAPQTGSLIKNWATSTSPNMPVGQYTTLGIDAYISAVAFQTGSRTGTTVAELTSASYAFSAVAVPEPGTYAMLLAGLGLMGFMVRRRKA